MLIEASESGEKHPINDVSPDIQSKQPEKGSMESSMINPINLTISNQKPTIVGGLLPDSPSGSNQKVLAKKKASLVPSKEREKETNRIDLKVVGLAPSGNSSQAMF
mmetsp:Transcript_31988/g.48967  ORF Transcript_31988/g.48967 Transcript_31988/m.48967 type:complete len:106 (-) Transcript_31988:847-1164(-)